MTLNFIKAFTAAMSMFSAIIVGIGAGLSALEGGYLDLLYVGALGGMLLGAAGVSVVLAFVYAWSEEGK